jgi:hypothetical protein
MNSALQTIIRSLMARYCCFVFPHLVGMTVANRIPRPLQNLVVERKAIE